ncbi:ChaN family lipoprotein [Rhodovibrio salinarum]|uniref:ChaN family lipoprotein n=1 Tax=Rhodovibrio salinarum TaxID=1087 RepID=UPI000486E024|nr:ChaN family lipoprotein [Rhodovibrio salinarum]
MKPSRLRNVLVVAILATAPPALLAQAAELPPVPEFETPLHRDHPLVGQVYDAAGEQPVDPATVAEATAKARFVILGERHDNPDHHALQAWLVQAMTAQGRTPALAFEMIDQSQTPALEAYLNDHPDDATGLGPAVTWEERGWPAWSTYQPIAAAALQADLPILAANPTPEETRTVGRQGFAALDADRVAALGLDTPLPAAQRDRLLTELREGHCNLMPKEAMGPMANVQRLRDAVMADTLIAGAREQDRGAVLIAGGGHARADRAVPWYLRQRLDNPDVVVVRFLEVRPEVTDPAAYLPDQPDAAPRAFDYVWFTPANERGDPCADLKKRMEGHGD